MDIEVTLLTSDGSDNEYESNDYYLDGGQLFHNEELIAELDENDIDKNHIACVICCREHDYVVQIKLDNEIIYTGEVDTGFDLKIDEDELGECAWCGEEFPLSDLTEENDLGLLCDKCIRALKSRGEDITLK